MSAMTSEDTIGTGKIRKLDPLVVNKIAAGEIVIQPANALKELVENSIDAHSTMIDILVKDGGLKLLQITDNGDGIEKEDLGLLCERFATSKLAKFEDLESIATFGFRGEALASISHISRLSVITRSKSSTFPLAYKAYYINGKPAGQNFKGTNTEPKAIAGKEGTQLIVEDLFYNLPSRLSSIRSRNDEYLKILDVVGKYAVNSDGVGFSLKKHGDFQHALMTRPGMPLKERIRMVYGAECSNQLLDLEVNGDDTEGQYLDKFGMVKVKGAITNCNFNYRKKMQSIFFINQRLVSCDPLRRAIHSIYSIFLPKGFQPFVYISLELKPEILDVNIHPTKREVRFLHEEEIIEVIVTNVHKLLTSVDTSRTFKSQNLNSKRERQEEVEYSQVAKKYRQENKLVRVDVSQPRLNELLSHRNSGSANVSKQGLRSSEHGSNELFVTEEANEEIQTETLYPVCDEVSKSDDDSNLKHDTVDSEVQLEEAHLEEVQLEEAQLEEVQLQEVFDSESQLEKDKDIDQSPAAVLVVDYKDIEEVSPDEGSIAPPEQETGENSHTASPVEDLSIDETFTSRKQLRDKFINSATRAPSLPTSESDDETRLADTKSASSDDSDIHLEIERITFPDTMVVTGRKRVSQTLDSVIELRTSVTESTNIELTNIISKSSYIGLVDEYKRLCCFQHDVRLYLCDYSALLFEFYYQVALSEFCNYGIVELSEPVCLEEQLQSLHELDTTIPLQDAQSMIQEIFNMKDMFGEYFSMNFEKTDNKHYIVSLPMLVKDIMPCLNKLPFFLYKLATKINYEDEQKCLQGIMKQISLLYLPEIVEEEDSDESTRAETNKFLSETIFPLLRTHFKAPSSLSANITQIADLPGLYRIFERC
ncbi:DNA mismatch repair protein Mlh1 [Yamadazyma tenuis]|uniref:DNA mismatch repair protein Mlh1 n=1 Tax=Candida tenuis TaxID=2315449 RepID=UPI00279C5D3F|nr:DNA mismatch repair protein Mlh1 [Yamadazyma tenuis]